VKLSASCCQGRCAAEEQQLTLARLREVRIQVHVRWIGVERAPALLDRAIDRCQILLEHAHGFGVEALASFIECALQIHDRSIVVLVGEVRACNCRIRFLNLGTNRLHVGARISRSRHPHEPAGQDHQRESGGGDLRDRKRKTRGDCAPGLKMISLSQVSRMVRWATVVLVPLDQMPNGTPP